MTTQAPSSPSSPARRLTRVSRLATTAAVAGPLVALAGCYWSGLYAVHNLRARRGADWTGLAFAEGFLWVVAVGLALPVLLTAVVLLAVRRSRTDPTLLSAALSAVVALAGGAFACMVWLTVHDSQFVRPRSTEWAEPYVVAAFVTAVLPILVSVPLAVLHRRGRRVAA